VAIDFVLTANNFLVLFQQILFPLNEGFVADIHGIYSSATDSAVRPKRKIRVCHVAPMADIKS
jgi:hypothetical protein